MKATIKKFSAVAFCAVLVLSGCAIEQSSSRIQVPGAGSLSLPKNSRFEVLAYKQEPVALSSNLVGYRVSLMITNGSFTMDPAVIDKATAHDVGLLNAGGSLVIQGMGLALPK